MTIGLVFCYLFYTFVFEEGTGILGAVRYSWAFGKLTFLIIRVPEVVTQKCMAADDPSK